MINKRHLYPICILYTLFLLGSAPVRQDPKITVRAVVETLPVTSDDDAADDPAIWVHPSDPTQSLIVATDKTRGLLVYDLKGNLLQDLPDGKLNNVDIRGNWAVAGNRTDSSMMVYAIDPQQRKVMFVKRLPAGISVYGSCLYQSQKDGALYSIVDDKSGNVIQWRLDVSNPNDIKASVARRLKLASQTEGCVADDELAKLYVGEEAVGVWKFGAEPDQGSRGTLIDDTGHSGHLTADVEGMAIVANGPGKGYLIASSQGNNSYVVYRREGDNAYLKSFEVVGPNGREKVLDTDGIAATSTPLGEPFQSGVFVVQDGHNDGERQNFKLVPWSSLLDHL